MNDFQFQQKANESSKKRRHWSFAEKQEILKLAEATSVSEAARRHGIGANIIFLWRRQLMDSTKNSSSNLQEELELNKALKRINKMDKQFETASDKLLTGLKNGSISAYSAAVGLSSLGGTFGKLITLRLDLVDKLKAYAAVQKAEASSDIENEYADEMQREAERIVLHIVKSRILPQQEAERQQQANDNRLLSNG